MAVIPMLVATWEAMPDKLYLALSSYVTNATGAAFEESAVTRYHLIDGYVVSPLLQLSAAYRINPTWSVGAAAGMARSLRMKFNPPATSARGSSMTTIRAGERPLAHRAVISLR